LLGYPLSELNPDYEAEPLFMSPLNFRCSSCGAKTQIIDTKEHGYNSEIARLEGEQSFDSNYRGSGQPQEALCPQCEGSEFSITVKCLHSHFDLIEDEPDLEPRVQDFFDGFECFGTCSSCGEMTSFAGCELA